MVRRRDPTTQRLNQWGWHWALALARDPPWPAGTLGKDGPGGGVPGPRIPLHPQDWMSPDVVATHQAVMALADLYRIVVAAHYVSSAKTSAICADLGLAHSTYYWRLTEAHRRVAHRLTQLDKMQLDESHGFGIGFR